MWRLPAALRRCTGDGFRVLLDAGTRKPAWVPDMTAKQKRNVVIVRACQIAAIALVLYLAFVSTWPSAVDAAFMFGISFAMFGEVVTSRLVANGQLPEIEGVSDGESHVLKYVAIALVAAIVVALMTNNP